MFPASAPNVTLNSNVTSVNVFEQESLGVHQKQIQGQRNSDGQHGSPRGTLRLGHGGESSTLFGLKRWLWTHWLPDAGVISVLSDLG